MNALAAYGSGSSDSGSGSELDSDPDPDTHISPVKVMTSLGSCSKLPTPGFVSGLPSVQHSVFVNPFQQAELAKSAILEKHVKMVPVKDQTHVINGKKICWNYRKGRCRFGHNCKFAHDSDIQKTPEELEAEKQGCKSVLCEKTGTQSVTPPPTTIENLQNTDDDAWEGDSNKPKLKRPGLSQGIVPGRKVLKIYQQQKLNSSKK